MKKVKKKRTKWKKERTRSKKIEMGVTLNRDDKNDARKRMEEEDDRKKWK